MAEEKLIHQQAFPEPAVGALIYNDKGEILLVQGPKFADYWNLVGGHIEVGETAADALRREVMEEVGLEINNVEFLYWSDAINPEFFHKKIHFIFLDFIAQYSSGEVKTNEEINNYIWIHPSKALETLKLNSFTRRAVEKFMARGEEMDLFNKCEEYKFGWQRAVADYKNLQKETSERRQLLLEMSEQQILEEFIPVYDNFKKAFTHKEQGERNKEQDNWVTGIGYIMKQFGDILKQHKVEEVKTVGKKFDPKFHEAAGEEFADGEPGVILREVGGGYTMSGRVIKAAKVIISKQ